MAELLYRVQVVVRENNPKGEPTESLPAGCLGSQTRYVYYFGPKWQEGRTFFQDLSHQASAEMEVRLECARKGDSSWGAGSSGLDGWPQVAHKPFGQKLEGVPYIIMDHDAWLGSLGAPR